MKKLSRKARDIEARRAADPIAQAIGRSDIDYTDPDQLPTAPRMVKTEAEKTKCSNHCEHEARFINQFGLCTARGSFGYCAHVCVRHQDRIVTDSLGFRLEVEITVGGIEPRGRHTIYEDEQGPVGPHKIELRDGLVGSELAEVAAHEAYHLLYSVRNQITVDEETEAEVFGHLVKRLYEAASDR